MVLPPEVELGNSRFGTKSKRASSGVQHTRRVKLSPSTIIDTTLSIPKVQRVGNRKATLEFEEILLQKLSVLHMSAYSLV